MQLESHGVLAVVEFTRWKKEEEGQEERRGGGGGTIICMECMI